MFQPGGVVIVFDDVHRVGEAEGNGELDLIVRLVHPVPAPSLGLPEDGGGESVLAG